MANKIYAEQMQHINMYTLVQLLSAQGMMLLFLPVKKSITVFCHVVGCSWIHVPIESVKAPKY